MSGSTSTVWSLPLTLRVNFWAMSTVSSWMARKLGMAPDRLLRFGADARTCGVRPAGTLIQATADWNGYNDEILVAARSARRFAYGVVEAFRRSRRLYGTAWGR